MTRKTKRRLIIFFILIILVGGAGLQYFQTHYIRAEFRKFSLTEAYGNFNRPECGWYQLYSYKLKPDIHMDKDTIYINNSDGNGYAYRLALLEFNLSDYADKDIDAVAKSNIALVFQSFAATKMKLIIRFLYDWDGNGIENEPEKKSHIRNHMEQVSEILNEYKSQIYTTQGIFIGSWAEMHNSKFMSAQNMTSLLLTYAQYTDPSIFLAVRTPAQYRAIFNELEQNPEKYKNFSITPAELKQRLGLFNDGLFGSYSDLGTYQSVDAAPTEFEKMTARQQELNFQNEICNLVPNGGEAVSGSTLGSGKNAVEELSKMHISYLNHMYDKKLIEQWKKETISEIGNPYDEKTYYEYITDHLGARFVLTDCEINYTPLRGKYAKGIVTIVNKGFSSLYSEKDFSLCLIHNESKKETTLLETKDLEETQKTNYWNPETEIKIPFSFSPLDLEDGDYELVAALKDPDTEDEISFANHVENDNGYVLGTLTIIRPKLLTPKNESSDVIKPE